MYDESDVCIFYNETFDLVSFDVCHAPCLIVHAFCDFSRITFDCIDLTLCVHSVQ